MGPKREGHTQIFPHFLLNGYVNEQNWRIRSDDKQQTTIGTPLYYQILTGWCAIWVKGIIGRYFFKNEKKEDDHAYNGERYLAMINDFFVLESKDVELDVLWMMRLNTAGLFLLHETKRFTPWKKNFG